MLLLLLLLAFAYVQDNFGRKQPAYVWAVAFFVASIVFLMIMGDDFVASTIVSVLLGLYAWGYFGALRHFGGAMTAWVIICLVGALLPMFISMMFV